MSEPISERISNYLRSGGLFNPELMEHDKVRHLLIDVYDRIKEMEHDKKRLDWLQQKFGMWHQGNVLDIMNDEWRCSSGFHRGRTARSAIDEAMQSHGT